MQAQTQSKSLPTDKFLTMSVNLLNKALLESTRTDAKKLFRQILEGREVAITHLEMEDKSLVRVDLALYHNEFPGKLNFRAFRQGLAVLLTNAVEALKTPEDLRTFRSEENPNAVLFGLTGIVIDDDVPSVLALGVETGRGDPSILLQLSYLDPKQFMVDPETDAVS